MVFKNHRASKATNISPHIFILVIYPLAILLVSLIAMFTPIR